MHVYFLFLQVTKNNLQLDLLAKPAAGAVSQLHILRVATEDQATG
jgi:hypothetical protein